MCTVIIENVQIPVVNIVIQFLFHMSTNIILLWLIVVCRPYYVAAWDVDDDWISCVRYLYA